MLLNQDVTGAVIGAAMEVHRRLGPGLLESAYELCLAAEMAERGINFVRQHAISIRYGDLLIEAAYRADFLVEQRVLVELKSVATLDRVHLAQVLTYLKLSGLHTALLINFNVPILRDAIRRLVL